MNNRRKKITVSEILANTVAKKSREEKIEYLGGVYGEPWMEMILRYMYDKTIKIDLPPGVPPYVENPYEESTTYFWQNAKRLRIFWKNHPTYGPVKPVKKQQLFIQMLEEVHPDDAKLLLEIKDRNVYPGLTKDIVRKAFPGIFEKDMVI